MIVQSAEKNNLASFSFSFSRWFSYTSSTETMRSWPKLVATVKDIPDNFRELYIPVKKAHPYTVLIPEDVFLFANRAVRTRPQLIMLSGDKITVLEDNRNKIDSVVHDIKDIHYIKTQTIFLSANITISSPAGISSLNFNAARDDLFEPIIAAVRQSYDEGRTGSEEEYTKIRNAGGIDYKFANYGINSLLPGRKIKNILFQESINLKKMKTGVRKWFNAYTSPALLIRSDEELTIIEEPIKTRKNKKLEYGGIYTYIPLKKIKNTGITDGIFRKMEIALINNDTKTLYFPPDRDLAPFQI